MDLGLSGYQNHPAACAAAKLVAVAGVSAGVRVAAKLGAVDSPHVL